MAKINNDSLEDQIHTAYQQWRHQNRGKRPSYLLLDPETYARLEARLYHAGTFAPYNMFPDFEQNRTIFGMEIFIKANWIHSQPKILKIAE